MSQARLLLSYVAVILLTLGYLASQVSAIQGSSRYAEAVSSSSVKWLMLLLLLGAVVFAFVPEKDPQ